MSIEGKQVYRLQGLSCTNCAAKFERNIREIETVEDVQLNFGASKITIYGDASVIQLEKAGEFDGIKVIPEHQKWVEQKVPFWKKRGNVTASISLLLVMIGYLASFQLGEKNPLTIGVFAASIVIGGYFLFTQGFKNLFRLQFDMKTLMTIAIIGAALIGEWSEGAVVVFLFALSEALEGYSIEKARQSIRSLMKIAPSTATIIRNGREIDVDVNDIEIDDIMLIKPGQKIGMDGEVISGESTINQAAITGESIPAHKVVGDEVFAGTINQEGSLEVRVTKRVEDTTLAKIIHLVEEAQAEKAPTQRFVDRFAKYYTPLILVIAFFVATLPPLFFAGSWEHWIYQGLAVLVVGCPCALVISTPVAIVTAIGNAARNGVLIKGGIHLEETSRINVIAFDKTGTLTAGQPEVTDIVSFSSLETNEILQIAAAVEKHSQHPLASAIVKKANKELLELPAAQRFQSITGKGAKAFVRDSEYFIGSPKHFEDMYPVSENVLEKVNDLQNAAKTVMLVGNTEEVLGLLAVSDRIRKSSFSIIQKLKKLGIEKTVMLTGDNKATAEAIGKQLGLSEVQAELLPHDKLSEIRRLLEQHGSVAMVGDGVNDAPALATATVGIAMGGAGTDTALETADIALMADDLEKLPDTIALSRKALQIIKQNISLALALKLIALLLIIPGWLTLWLAIFADMGATLLVVANSLRLMKIKV